MLLHREPREQRVALEDHAAVRAGPGDGMAVEQNFAAGGFIESGDDADERGFAATGRADDADEFAAVDVERHVVEDDVRAAVGAEALFRSRTLRMTGRCADALETRGHLGRLLAVIGKFEFTERHAIQDFWFRARGGIEETAATARFPNGRRSTQPP